MEELRHFDKGPLAISIQIGMEDGKLTEYNSYLATADGWLPIAPNDNTFERRRETLERQLFGLKQATMMKLKRVNK